MLAVLAQRMRRRGPALPEAPPSLEWAVTGHPGARSFRDSKSLQLLRVRARALFCIRHLVGREAVAHYLSASRPRSSRTYSGSFQEVTLTLQPEDT